jgi:hypothetical protein
MMKFPPPFLNHYSIQIVRTSLWRKGGKSKTKNKNRLFNFERKKYFNRDGFELHNTP